VITAKCVHSLLASHSSLLKKIESKPRQICYPVKALLPAARNYVVPVRKALHIIFIVTWFAALFYFPAC
jgi:hypothetical protein